MEVIESSIILPENGKLPEYLRDIVSNGFEYMQKTSLFLDDEIEVLNTKIRNYVSKSHDELLSLAQVDLIETLGLMNVEETVQRLESTCLDTYTKGLSKLEQLKNIQSALLLVKSASRVCSNSKKLHISMNSKIVDYVQAANVMKELVQHRDTLVSLSSIPDFSDELKFLDDSFRKVYGRGRRDLEHGFENRDPEITKFVSVIFMR